MFPDFSNLSLCRKVSCAEGNTIEMGGEIRALAPALGISRQKAEFGEVSLEEVVVTQLVAAPVTTDLVQPAGKAGAETASKLCANVCAGTGAPRFSGKMIEPKVLVPSDNCKVAETLEPQGPEAVNVKDRLAAPTNAASAP